MIYKPSDLGYSDEGYDLPELKVFWHEIPADHTKAWDKADDSGQRFLLQHEAMGIIAGAKEKRETITERLAKAKEIVSEYGPDNNWLMWHHLEGERAAIEKAFPESLSVYGQLDLEERENRVMDLFDPFGGIATVPLTAAKMDRFGMGTELNADYWRDGCFYLKQNDLKMNIPTLFDALS